MQNCEYNRGMKSDAARQTLALHVVVFIAIVGVLMSIPLRSEAAATALTNWAWSDTVGWISLNCSDLGTCGTVNYGLSVDSTTGAVSGYAWSDNVGWISADDVTDTNCPAGSACKPMLSGGALTGWLKALAGGTPNSGGWDGWISLSGPNPFSYGPTFSNGAFTGYAWGSDVVGWVDFSRPGASLSVAPTSIQSGENAYLTWSSANATSCTGTNFDTRGQTSGTNVRVSPTVTTTYGGSCTGPGGTVPFNSVTLTVTCSTVPYCTNAARQRGTGPTYNIITQLTSACEPTYLNAPNGCQAPDSCFEGSAVCVVPTPGFNPSGNLTGHLKAIPDIVQAGTTTRLYWDISNVTSCTVTGTNGDGTGSNSTGVWNTKTAGPSGVQSSTITHETKYKLHCDAYSGANPSAIDETVTVKIVPVFREL